MSNYQPASRRPIASAFRATATQAVRLCVRCNIHPDFISYASIVASALAALGFFYATNHPVFLLIAPLFCYLRLWFNMLDGMVALASGKASLRGEILNDLPDRISDVIIFVGVAHSGFNHILSGYWAAIFALLTAYVGTLGQAVGVQREFSGIMSKPWRMVTLQAGAWLTAGFLLSGHDNPRWANLSALDWTCIVIILGCIQTIWIRLVRILRALRRKDARG
jgi:phosphatidylglycerophosphate synthase